MCIYTPSREDYISAVLVRRRHRVGGCCQRRLIRYTPSGPPFRVRGNIPSFIIVAVFLQLARPTSGSFILCEIDIHVYSLGLYFSTPVSLARPQSSRDHPSHLRRFTVVVAAI